MEYETVFTATKWKILEELSRKEQSPSELAGKLGTSIANISQQIKLLEAYGFVEQEKTDNNNEPGKPKTIYSNIDSYANIVFFCKIHAKKKLIKLDRFHKVVMSIWMLENEEDHYFLQKLLWHNEELIEKCKAITYIKSNSNEIELLIITDHLEEVRKNFSNIVIESIAGKKKKIVSWTHSEQEIEEGFSRKEEYYLNLTKKLEEIYDPKYTIKKLMEKRP